MKNGLKTVLMVFLISLFLMGTVSCNKLKVDNLKANDHFKKANKFYTEGRFKKAIDEYDKVLKFNPNLHEVYKYLGTACATLYRPGDAAEDNKKIGEKAQDSLKKAQEYEPDDTKIILALGQLSDKMKNFEEAEKQYQKVLEKDRKNPDNYIILADFYKSYDKKDKVLDMYQQRIELNPNDPDAYLYPAKYYFDLKDWDNAMRYHELRIAKIEQSTTLDEKQKKEKLADAYYRIGHLCWAHSYQTPVDPPMMSPPERNQIIEKGLEALKKATEINPLYPDPWVYMGLLWLEKGKIEPIKIEEFKKKRDELVKKYQDLLKQKKDKEDELRKLQREK